MGTAVNDYEPVFDALLDHIQAALTGTFKTCERRVAVPSNTPKQPALYLRQTGIVDRYDGDGLGKVYLEGELWLYMKPSADKKVAPGVALSGLVKKVRDTFLPDNPFEGTFTLERRVAWCRMDGRTLLWPGDDDDQGVAMIPFTVLVP